MKQPVLCKLRLLVEFPGGLEPAECSISSTLAFVDAVFDTRRPTTVKVATVCYPVCLLIKYLVQLDRVFAKLGTVFEDAVPTPVCFRQLFVATLGLVSLGKVSALLHLTSKKTESI
jgi:hypothetical protein